MSAAPQRGRRRAQSARRPSIFGLATACLSTRTAGHVAGSPGSPGSPAASAKYMAAVAVVGALVAAGAVTAQIGAPSGPDGLASVVAAAEAPAVSDASAVSAPIDAAITFPGVHVSSSASTAPAAVKAKADAVKPVTVDDPAGAQAYAAGQLASFGWGADQMSCLTQLWQRESEWLTSAENVSSGAYGIAQSLPASKMESTGSDWSTNYETQIRWGLGYIQGRYGSPCGAWGHSNAAGWY